MSKNKNKYENITQKISKEFLIMMLRSLKNVDTQEELKMIFRVFDKNPDGCIPTDELRSVFHRLDDVTQDEIEEMLG